MAARASSRCGFPGRVRVTSSDPDGVAHPTQLLDEVGGDGFHTMVTGQKVRWVLDLMRGTEFAGRQIHSYEVTDVDGAPTSTERQRSRPEVEANRDRQGHWEA